MKRFFALFLILVLTVGLFSCLSADEPEEPSDASQGSSDQSSDSGSVSESDSQSHSESDSNAKESIPVVTKKTVDVYLIAGQSNAGGHTKVKNAAALYAENPALEQGIKNVLYAGNARSSSGSTLYNHQISLTPTKLGFGRVDGSAQAYMGPEVGMASALSAYYNEESGKTAALIKMAHGGTSLLNKTTGMNQFGNWVSPSYAEHLGVTYKDRVGGLYRALLGQVETNVEALKEMGYTDIRICGIYWMQGEADSSSDASVLAEYETALKFLISDLRSDLADIMVELTGAENGAASMPFIVGTVSETCGAVDNPTATVAKHSAFNAMLRRTVPTVANCYLIENSAYDTVDISGSTPVVVGSDQYHWNQSDAYEIGTHVGECILDNQLCTKDSE